LDSECGNDFCCESSNKFQKPGFGRKKSVEIMVTLGPTAQATLVAIIP
jgi:hypothetical protein